MRVVSPTIWAGLVFVAALSPIIIFVRSASVIGKSNAELVFSGTEALLSVVWVVLVAGAVGAAALYAVWRYAALSTALGDLTKREDSLYRLSISDGKVFRGREHVTLAPLQFKLLEYLIEHEGALCKTEDILQELYGNPDDRQALNQLNSRLRTDLTIHDYIQRNENNLGYSFNQWTPPASSS